LIALRYLKSGVFPLPDHRFFPLDYCSFLLANRPTRLTQRYDDLPLRRLAISSVW
jgi:hypothetical protein